jgi:hypothetical protein
MKLLSIIFILVLSFAAFGQSKPNPTASKYIELRITDDGATSELLPMPIVMSPNLSGAEIGIKYFGVKSESDVSFVLILKGTKNRYAEKETFGVKLFSDDVALNSNKYRVINFIDKAGGGDASLHFYLTLEDLAWLASAETSIKIEVYNSETEKKYDTFSLTKAGFGEFKRFAKSVLLIKSHLQ